MRKTITKEVMFCDKCKKETNYVRECTGCGIEYCDDCYEKHMVKYAHSVDFSGTYDGRYCDDCFCHYSNDPFHKNTIDDTIFSAYVIIKHLREERNNYYKEFNKRAMDAEEQLVRLLKEKKK